MSSTGTTTSISSGLRDAGVDDGHRARARPSAPSWPPRKRATSSSGRWVADSPMRCGGRSRERVEPLEARGQVGAALGGGQGVDLVDDHGLDVAQRLAGLRREQQVERLRRGDQEVGRVADQRLALVGRRVAGAHRRPSGSRNGTPEPLGGEADARPAARAGSSPRRRRAPAAARCRGPGCAPSRRRLGGDQPVDRGEERGEGLAGAGGCAQQRVPAGGDGGPRPGPAPPSAPGTTSRTTPAPPARSPPAPDDRPWRKARPGCRPFPRRRPRLVTGEGTGALGGSHVRPVRLRPWQQEALAAHAASGARDFLAVATPGAGKTTFALAARCGTAAPRRGPIRRGWSSWPRPST